MTDRIFVFLNLLAACSAILEIYAETCGAKTCVYVLKPLTMVFILALALASGGSNPSLSKWLILMGLLFSLAGDVFLMLPSDRFTSGLASFLIAHLFYIAAFSRGTDLWNTFWSPLPFFLFALGMLIFLWPSLGQDRIAVAVYVTVIVTMAWRALERRLQTEGREGWFAFVGAVLFLMSDSALAVDRFRGEFAGARIVILGTYFAAQWFIAASIGR